MNLRQAKSLKRGDIVHYVANHPCSRISGPRGGVTIKITKCRVSGEPHVWRRSPERVQVPVKYGLYVNSYITEENLNDWHHEKDCPLKFLPSAEEVDQLDSLDPLINDGVSY